MAVNFGRRLRSSVSKIYWREVLALLMLLLAIFFFRSERKELQAIIPHIKQSVPLWIVIGIATTFLYFICQAGIYRQSFAAIGLRLPWGTAIILFLKRNFMSVFLPAGGLSSLAYSPAQLRKEGFNQTQVHQASAIFGFTGLLTVFIAGLPIIIFTIVQTNQFKDAWYGLVVIFLVIILIVALAQSIQKKGMPYQWLDKKFPSFTPTINELFAANVNKKKFAGGVLYSLGVELSGIFHIYIAMLALGLPASIGAAAAAYIIAVLLMVVSPFLRGLGAVEISMVFVLEQFGYRSIDALSVTVLFRVFEFWLPLLIGLIAFAWKGKNLFFRMAPALLTFLLGVVNIISAVTPPDRQRLYQLREYIPLGTIQATNMLVLFTGLSLLITAAFLFRGLRSAWIIALSLSAISLFAHFVNALDYEEAFTAALTIFVLIATVRQYPIRSSNKWMQLGLKTALLSFIAVVIFGFVSFYFIDKKHFAIDFTWQQSVLHTFKIFLLVKDDTLAPVTKFGHDYIMLIRVLGFFTWGFLLFTLIRSDRKLPAAGEAVREKATFLLTQFGNSSGDYFKLYKDKLYFFSDIHQAFIAYRIANGFAIVLEEPVCAEENKTDVLTEFDRHCRKMGLKSAYYRVDENSIHWFNQLRKNKIMIGQEAVLEIHKFTLDGKDKKSLRNGLNSLQKKGYTTSLHLPPHHPNFIILLKNVSDEWLINYEKEELIFSQGMFDRNELQQQPIITVTDEQDSVKAFLNIIPDYAEEEITYDLIRKTDDAPGAAMDALIIKLIEYAKEKNKQFLNLGLVPMTGITVPDNTAEQIIKLAAAKIKRFHHYRGLREFKEKYATIWENKYLVYDNDFDLLQLPLALNNVMKP